MIAWLLAALGLFVAVVSGVAALTSWLVAPKLAGVPLAAGLVVGWLALVVFYYAWAIYRYNINLGLDDQEWDDLKARAGGDETRAADLQEPDANPYESESFGLPPGTVRGTLALTALVLFVAVELVNLQNTGVEGQFKELIIGFQMVLAFYFGSRAVEVLEKGRPAAAPEKEAAPSLRADEAAKAEARAPQEPVAIPPAPAIALPDATPEERPAMSSTVSAIRMAAISLPAGAVAPPPGMQLAATTSIAKEPLVRRVLALTSSFETGIGFPDNCGIAAGNFDGQGLSFGVLQWNIGQGTLQPLLAKMLEQHGDVAKDALGADRCSEVAEMLEKPLAEQMKWALRIQRTATRDGRTRWILSDDWKKALLRLGKTPEMIQLQVAEATRRLTLAEEWCRDYGLTCERAVALMFDINVQNGKVDRGGADRLIRQDVSALPPTLPAQDQELEKMLIIARRRSEVVAPAWREDVRARKETIAKGHGRVHGHEYDLERQFGLTLDPVPELRPPPVV